MYAAGLIHSHGHVHRERETERKRERESERERASGERDRERGREEKETEREREANKSRRELRSILNLPAQMSLRRWSSQFAPEFSSQKLVGYLGATLGYFRLVNLTGMAFEGLGFGD